jgi:DNA-binding CsgD family transcriptional regulator
VLDNHPDNVQESALSQALRQILPSILEGIILFDENDRLIYMNSKASTVIQRILENCQSSGNIPHEIVYIKDMMIEVKEKFPQENWVNEFNVCVNHLTVIHIYARWIQGNGSGQSYLLLKMEDKNQLNQDLLLDEAKRLGLTLREQEVWLLSKTNYTYKQIAEILDITLNTVKKHMKSILVKQRLVDRP